MKFYAGIGSRQTPLEFKDVMRDLAIMLRDKGYILRSGHADGADLFFESGAGEFKEIFIPWKGFNGSLSTLYTFSSPEIQAEAFSLAEKYHPKWDKLSLGAKKLMARNCCQVLGSDLRTPIDFVVCWTQNGGIMGGTGQALRMARDFKIPVFNLYREDAIGKLKTHVGKTILF